MPDIFLKRGASSPSDVILSVPTTITYIGVPLDMGGMLPQYQSTYFQARSEPPYLPQVPLTVSQGWQPPLSTAALRVPAQIGFSFVPFGTAQLSTNYTDLSWYQPLAGAPSVVKTQLGLSSVPFDTAQLSVNYTDFNWYQPLAGAPPVVKAQAGYSFVPLNTAQAPLNFTDFSWQPALSAALPLPKAQAGFSSIPFVPQSYLSIGWQSPLSVAVASSNFAGTDYSLPVYTPFIDNTVTIDKWQRALSAPPAITKARPGFSSVPFNTVQVAAAVAASGIPIDAGGALPKVQTTYYQATFVPPYYVAPAVVSYTNLGWYQPLSTPAKITIPQARIGLVPFNITQVTPAVTDTDRIVKFIGNVGHMMLR